MTGEPFLRVVRGTPDDAELAALAAVLAGLSAAAHEDGPADRSAWSEPRAMLRRPHDHGHGAWRRSAFPG
jgi:acyl-CoA carboxylase epsilon subunit